VTIRNYDTTVASIKGLENAETDISPTTEYSMVTEAFNKENISVIGCIDKYQLIYLVGRKDRGIENISDLDGKKNRGYPGHDRRVLSRRVPQPSWYEHQQYYTGEA
jgi:TRAP-type uncharacterized transport system substrate-binding protein